MKQMIWSLMLASAMTTEQEQQLDKTILLITFLFTGISFIGISIPLLYEKIKPNKWYGFRTRKTFSSEEIWYKANKYMGKDLIIFGCLMILYNLVLFVLPIDTLFFVCPGNLIISVAGVSIVLVRSLLYLRKL